MRDRSRVTHGSRQSSAERRYLRAAIFAGAALALATVAVFTGTGPLSSHYEISGVFASANDLVPGSLVRIAGVDVGQVSSITPGPGKTSLVTMDIGNAGLPIHSDATLAIEPRLILEGNFYVNLDPGTPSAPVLRSGGLISEGATSAPVQIDQVLGTFDRPTRTALHDSIQNLSTALGAGVTLSSATGGVGPIPTGYGGLRAAVRALDQALPSIRKVGIDAQGTTAGDEHIATHSFRDFTTELAQDPTALAGLVTNLNTVTGALSAEDQALASSVRLLDRTTQAAPAALTALDGALPTLTASAQALTPALRSAPAPVREATALTAQVQALVEPAELPALLQRLAPITATLPRLEVLLGHLLPLVTPVNRCLSGNVIPALDKTVPDGHLTTGDPAWLDLLHAATAITSVEGGFDGNGSALRAGLAEGASTVSGVLPGVGQVAGFAPSFVGLRPTWLGFGVLPPYRPDQWCDKQPLPNLAAASGPAPAWDRPVATAPTAGAR